MHRGSALTTLLHDEPTTGTPQRVKRKVLDKPLASMSEPIRPNLTHADMLETSEEEHQTSLITRSRQSPYMSVPRDSSEGPTVTSRPQLICPPPIILKESPLTPTTKMSHEPEHGSQQIEDPMIQELEVCLTPLPMEV